LAVLCKTGIPAQKLLGIGSGKASPTVKRVLTVVSLYPLYMSLFEQKVGIPPRTKHQPTVKRVVGRRRL